MGNYFSEQTDNCQFEDVPLLVLENIARFLPLIDVLSFRLVNKYSFVAAEWPHFTQLSSFNSMVLFQRCTSASKIFGDQPFQTMEESQRRQLTDLLFGKVSKNHFVCHQILIVNNLLILITNHCSFENSAIVELNIKNSSVKIFTCPWENYVEKCLQLYFNCVYPKPSLFNFTHPFSFCSYIDNVNGDKIYTIDYQHNTIYKSIFDFKGNELAKFESRRVDFYFFFNGGLSFSQHSGNPFSILAYGSVMLAMWMQSNVNIIIRPFHIYKLNLVSTYRLPFNERLYFVLNLVPKLLLLSIDSNDIHSVKLHLTFEKNPLENLSFELLDPETLFTGQGKLQRIDPVGKTIYRHEHWFFIQRIEFDKVQ